MMATQDGPAPFGVLLQHYRAAAGLSQEELAERAGLSRRGISDLERGARRSPHPATVRRVVEALGLDDVKRAALLAASRAGDLSRLSMMPMVATARAGTQPLDQPPIGSGTTPNLRHNLPLLLTSFVGREGERAEVIDLLTANRQLTLTGAGGVGKTRLALEVASGLVSNYAEGVWLVELAPLTNPALVPQAITSALDICAPPGHSLAEALADDLRSKQALLVLDNCEHVIQTCAELTELLLGSCTGLNILATSREQLACAGERVWRVRPLAVPRTSTTRGVDSIATSPAVQLFVERAQAVDPTFRLTARNAVAVAKVCERLEGIPLALELAAARAQVLSPAQILERLDASLPVLASGRRTAPSRHQTLRATFDWSYELLSEAERRILARLAVFAGGCTLEAAEAMCGMDGMTSTDLLDALGRLVAKSLVDTEPGSTDTKRYRLHVLLRDYLIEHLASRGDLDHTRRQHALYLASLFRSTVVELRGPLQSALLQQLEREHANLRAALDWALTVGETEIGLRLGASLWRFWLYRGYLEDGEKWLTSLLAQPAADSVDRRVVIFGAGVVAYHRGDTPAARARYEALYRAATTAGDWERTAAALTQLGRIAQDEEDLERADTLYSESLTIRREHGDDWGAAISNSHLGLLSYRRRDTAAAYRFFEQALALSRAVENATAVATELLRLGHLDIDRGDRAGAEGRFGESLRLFRGLENRGGIAWALEGMARLVLVTGDAYRGFRLLGASAALLEAAGFQRPPPLGQVELLHAANSAREMLGEAIARAAEAEGYGQSPDEAIEEALAGMHPSQKGTRSTE